MSDDGDGLDADSVSRVRRSAPAHLKQDTERLARAQTVERQLDEVEAGNRDIATVNLFDAAQAGLESAVERFIAAGGGGLLTAHHQTTFPSSESAINVAAALENPRVLDMMLLSSDEAVREPRAARAAPCFRAAPSLWWTTSTHMGRPYDAKQLSSRAVR